MNITINNEHLQRIGFATVPRSTNIFGENQELVVEWNTHKVEKVDTKNKCLCYFIPPHMQDHIKNHAQNNLPQYHTSILEVQYEKAKDFRNHRNNNAIQFRKDDHQILTQPKIKLNGETIQKIYDARNKTTLPGKIAKDMNNKKTSQSYDVTVNRAFDTTKKTYDFYLNVFNRNSIDGKGMQLVSTVHYDRNYDNAFWNGKQMVYGDGDQTIFSDFTLDIDVPAHEMTHGVTERTLGLEYENQSGALNEHISDAFGSMIKQYSLKQTTENADWLIGDRVLVGPGALRSMRAPGKAYNTPQLGKDPQPAKMGDYAKMPNDEENDNGGVHINSGIPNHAFYLACIELGGNSWDKVGKIWYKTLNDKSLTQNANFVDFANSTIESAKNLSKGNKDWTGKEADAIRKAWMLVEVL